MLRLGMETREYLASKLANHEMTQKCQVTCDPTLVVGMEMFYLDKFNDYDLLNMALDNHLIDDKSICQEIGGRWRNDKCWKF